MANTIGYNRCRTVVIGWPRAGATSRYRHRTGVPGRHTDKEQVSLAGENTGKVSQTVH